MMEQDRQKAATELHNIETLLEHHEEELTRQELYDVRSRKAQLEQLLGLSVPKSRRIYRGRWDPSNLF